MMYVVAHSYCADTRKITADTVVIARTKLYTSAATTAGFSSGSSTVRSTVKPRAPSVTDASSRLLSIWVIDAMPARTPTGMLRKMLQTTRMIAVPVISMGGTLNARMYDTPMTVPGIANDIIVPNSNADWPTNFCRVSRYAARMPSAAVSGAAIAESSTVVQNEFHAAPVHRRPCGPHSTPNA